MNAPFADVTELAVNIVKKYPIIITVLVDCLHDETQHRWCAVVNVQLFVVITTDKASCRFVATI